MNWWGKLIGTGVGMIGGPIGALAGAAIGHLYDEDDPTPQNERKARILYFAYFFSCAAKIAKADGSVSSEEIKATEQIMARFKLDEKTKDFAKKVFRKAKNSKRSIATDFREVGSLIAHDPELGLSFLGGLFEIVSSNRKTFNEIQVRLLLIGEKHLKLKPRTVQNWIRQGYSPPFEETGDGQMSLHEAYSVLEAPVEATDSEIKKAYRIKASKFHPDKLKSKDLPEEFIHFANSELAKINLAHKTILNSRKKS